MSQALATTDDTQVAGIAAENQDDFVTFTIKGQLFGIPVLNVQDILTPSKIAAVPLAPPEIRGSINLRGRIVTVIDVRIRLGMESLDEELAKKDEKNETAEKDEGAEKKISIVKEKRPQQMGVTVENQNELYTLLVDAIGDVISVEKDRFDSNLNTLDPAWREFSSGVCRLDDRLMVVFDVERLLDIKIKQKKADQ